LRGSLSMRSTELVAPTASSRDFIVPIADELLFLSEVLTLTSVADVEAEDHPALDARLALDVGFFSEIMIVLTSARYCQLHKVQQMKIWHTILRKRLNVKLSELLEGGTGGWRWHGERRSSRKMER